MAQDISKLAVVLTAKGAGFAAGMKAAGKDVNGLASQVDAAGSRIAGVFTKLAGLGAGLLGGLGLGQSIKLASDFEQAEIAMTTMLKSADEAKSVLSELSTFAAETPFEFPELLDASRKLIGFGVVGKDVLPTLRLIGDVASGTSTPINELAEAFGRNLAAGRLYMKDINEFQGRGIPILQALGKQLGKTRVEVLAMVEAGEIGSAHLIAAFQTMAGPGGQFFGLMDAQSQSTAGLFSTLKDNVGIGLRQIGQMLIQELNVKPRMKDLIVWMGGFAQKAGASVTVVIRWTRLNWDLISTIAKWTLGLGAAIYVITKFIAIGKAIVATYQAITKSQVILLALSGPKGWAQLAAGATIAALAIAGVAKVYGDISSAADQVVADSNRVAAAQEKVATSANQIDAAAGVAKAQQDQLRTSIVALNKEYLEQVTTFGLSKRGQDIYALAQQGATAAQLESVEAMRKQLDMMDAYKTMTEAAAEALKAMQEPAEKLAEKLEEINKWEKAGLVTADQADALSRAAADSTLGSDIEKRFPQVKRKNLGTEFSDGKVAALERRFSSGFTDNSTANAMKKLEKLQGRTATATERTAKAAERTAKNTTDTDETVDI